jgi:hypothetical protein
MDLRDIDNTSSDPFNDLEQELKAKGSLRVSTVCRALKQAQSVSWPNRQLFQRCLTQLVADSKALIEKPSQDVEPEPPGLKMILCCLCFCIRNPPEGAWDLASAVEALERLSYALLQEQVLSSLDICRMSKARLLPCQTLCGHDYNALVAV